MIKRLIFDADGTLITGVNFTNAAKNTLERLSLFSEENLNIFLQNIAAYEQIYNSYNRHDYIHHFSKALNYPLDDSFLSIFFQELKKAVPPRNSLLIKKIQELYQKYELVLLTNYFRLSQLNRLNAMEIGEYFSDSFGEESIKPNQNAYLSALGNHKPFECVMIGDDLYLDIQRAQEEGLHTIFVNSKNKNVSPDIGMMVSSVTDITIDMIEQFSNKNA